MPPLNEDIKAEIESQKKIISMLKQRRRALEQQMAKFGDLYVPPYVVQEIAEITNQIALQNKELAKLESKAVEGELPLAEVEFRILVAQAWSNSSGWLSAFEEAKLELSRLHLSITSDRADQHYEIVKSQLAVETLLDFDLNDIQATTETRSKAVQRIIRAFRFSPKQTEDLLNFNMDSNNAHILVEWIQTTKTIWRSENEYKSLKSLFDRLLQSKQSIKKPLELPKNISQTWKGEYIYSNASRKISMILEIQEINDKNFSGRIEWPNNGHTITKMSGQIIKDSIEQQRLTHIHNFQTGVEQTQLKFTETEYIQGHQTQLNGQYYALISKENIMIGKLFLTEKNIPNGTFELHLEL